MIRRGESLGRRYEKNTPRRSAWKIMRAGAARTIIISPLVVRKSSAGGCSRAKNAVVQSSNDDRVSLSLTHGGGGGGGGDAYPTGVIEPVATQKRGPTTTTLFAHRRARRPIAPGRRPRQS